MKKQPSKKTKSTTPVARTGTKKSGKSKSASSFFDTDRGLFILLALSVLLCFIARIQLLAIPLERDEGSFAYISHWLWRGRSLYTDMLDSKLPGLYAYYGLFTTLFGYNKVGIHIGLLCANIASGVCFFFCSRKCSIDL